jgi:hypothetical protein
VWYYCAVTGESKKIVFTSGATEKITSGGATSDFWSPHKSTGLVGLTTFDPWVGNLKCRWLDILKFEGLEYGRDFRPLF